MTADQRTRSVCLITPGHLSTNPRLVKEADALVEAGYRVSVVAADYAKWARRADLEFSHRSWQPVLKIAFGPEAPKPRYLVQTLRRRASLALVKLGGTRLELIESAVHPIVPALVRAARKIPAQLYIAHYIAALPAAARAAAYHGTKFGFDAEDYHLGELPDGPRNDIARRLISAIESHYLPRSAYLTAASPGIAEAYAERYGLRSSAVVLNAFSKERAPKSPASTGSAALGPSVYWFSQTIGPNRGLETAVRALSIASSRPHLYLRGNLAADYAEKLLALSKEVGAGDRLHFLDTAPPAEMEALAADYDLGLASEPGSTKNNSILLANKLFTYLLAGLPIVASATPAHTKFSELARDATFLYEPENPPALAAAFDSLFCDKRRLARARAWSWQLGQSRFNWEIEKEAFLRVVASVFDE